MNYIKCIVKNGVGEVIGYDVLIHLKVRFFKKEDMHKLDNYAFENAVVEGNFVWLKSNRIPVRVLEKKVKREESGIEDEELFNILFGKSGTGKFNV